MNNLSHHTVRQQYAEAMRYSGLEAVARLAVADRLAASEVEAVLREARRDGPRVRPLVRSVGALLVRLGERLEAVETMQRGREYA